MDKETRMFFSMLSIIICIFALLVALSMGGEITGIEIHKGFHIDLTF